MRKSTPRGLSKHWHPAWRLALRVLKKSEQVDVCGSGHVLAQPSRESLKTANIDTFRISQLIPLGGCQIGMIYLTAQYTAGLFHNSLRSIAFKVPGHRDCV